MNINKIDKDSMELKITFSLALISLLINAIHLRFTNFLILFSFISICVGYTAYDFKKEHGIYPWSKELE